MKLIYVYMKTLLLISPYLSIISTIWISRCSSRWRKGTRSKGCAVALKSESIYYQENDKIELHFFNFWQKKVFNRFSESPFFFTPCHLEVCLILTFQAGIVSDWVRYSNIHTSPSTTVAAVVVVGAAVVVVAAALLLLLLLLLPLPGKAAARPSKTESRM